MLLKEIHAGKAGFLVHQRQGSLGGVSRQSVAFSGEFIAYLCLAVALLHRRNLPAEENESTDADERKDETTKHGCSIGGNRQVADPLLALGVAPRFCCGALYAGLLVSGRMLLGIARHVGPCGAAGLTADRIARSILRSGCRVVGYCDGLRGGSGRKH